MSLGTFSGTRTFTFSYESVGPDTAVLLGNNQRGESALRFGETPTYGGFTQANTPGPDGTPASDLGLFTSVIVDFNAPVTLVPEPSTLGLTVAAAFTLVAWGGRRRRA